MSPEPARSLFIVLVQSKHIGITGAGGVQHPLADQQPGQGLPTEQVRGVVLDRQAVGVGSLGVLAVAFQLLAQQVAVAEHVEGRVHAGRGALRHGGDGRRVAGRGSVAVALGKGAAAGKGAQAGPGDVPKGYSRLTRWDAPSSPKGSQA